MRAQENLTKVWGKHTIKGGYEILRTRYNVLAEALPSGKYFMSGTELPFATAGTTGNDFADLLLGYVGQAQFTQALATWLPRWWSHAAYVQDDFKPSRNLTINFGVRWSYESPYTTKYGQQSEFDPTAKDPISGRLGRHRAPARVALAKLLERLPAARRRSLEFPPRIVFRGNFGIITQDLFMTRSDRTSRSTWRRPRSRLRWATPGRRSGSRKVPGRFSSISPADGSAPFVGTNFSSRNASWIDPNIRPPYIMNWSGGVQWQLTSDVVMETIYQGSAGVGLLNNWDINVLPLNVASDYATLDNIRRNYQNFKPYPQFGSIQLYSNFGHNTYHSATVRMERRYRGGLFVNGFYTWSKNLTDADADGAASGVTYYNRRLEKARSNFDVSHRFVATFIYEFPFGKGRHWGNHGGIVNAVLGGWNLMVSQTIQSGPPITVTFAGAPSTPYRAGPALRLASHAAAAESDPAQRSGSHAGLDDRGEPAPDQRAESLPQCRGVRLSGAVHGRHAGAQYADVSGAGLGADLALQDLETARTPEVPNSVGFQQSI